MKRFLLGIQRLTVGAGCVVALLLGIFLLFIDRVAAGSACLSASVVLFFLTNIEMFESFKGPGGVEARLRDLTKQVTETAELTQRLKGLVVSNAELSATLLTRSGYMADPLPREELLRRMCAVEAQLTAAGISRSDTLKVMADWHDGVVLQLLSPAYRAVYDCIKQRQQWMSQQWDNLKKPIEQSNPEYVRLLALREADTRGHEDFRNAYENGDHHARVALIKRVVSYLTADKLGRSFPDTAGIDESLKHAEYYLANRTFISEVHWINQQP
ncbi:hypothetical protein CF68_20380 [Cupriavidus sp. SK-4]|uniref:hypothetical protein n=1 Tax=Cupriavidus sp. SK-4 TaxID=574750 RepID=UPI00044A6336|nr:hypothetical protein [Cupriavidus sp. SK-4]EYS96463.1 hypothetical protein CF68_20380 [Cupriavidus sp. SK-4]